MKRFFHQNNVVEEKSQTDTVHMELIDTMIKNITRLFSAVCAAVVFHWRALSHSAAPDAELFTQNRLSGFHLFVTSTFTQHLFMYQFQVFNLSISIFCCYILPVNSF